MNCEHPADADSDAECSAGLGGGMVTKWCTEIVR